MEPFMDKVELAAPIDMEVSADNKIYVLVDGKDWFDKIPDAAIVRIDYNTGKTPVATVAKKATGTTTMGHQTGAPKELIGKTLMSRSDCAACHKVSGTSIGPAFNLVAKKYKTNLKAIDY